MSEVWGVPDPVPPKPARPWTLLVTGSRFYSRGEMVWGALEQVRSRHPGLHLLVGDCPTGVDAMALAWAREQGVPVQVVEADWKQYGRAAGPKRNEVMAKRRPNLVLVFPGGAGTTDMLRRARRRKLPILFAE